MGTAERFKRLEVQVLVVGAGPTGLTAANLLGRAGIETLVIERNESTVDAPRAVSIDDESLRTMQALGLIEEVTKDLILGYGYHYFSSSGRCFAKVLPSMREYGYPRRSAFRQPLLEATLRDGLGRFENARALFRHTLEAIAQDENGVTAAIRTADGEALEVRADYLAACDGGSSTVRGLLGIAMVGSSFEERWLVLDLVNRKDDLRHTHVHCDHTRPAITLPGPHRTRRWEFLVAPGEPEKEALEPETVRALLRRYGGDEDAEIIRKLVYTFHARVAERWREGRVFLLGDAAHLTPPFAGQGMNTGIRDAHNLAWKLAEAANGRIGPGLLESYEEERRRHAWEMIMLAVRMGRIMHPKGAFRNALLVGAVRLASLAPPVRDYFLEMKFKPKPRLTAGFLIPDGQSRRATLVGRMFPQPRVVAGDGSEVLLDEVTGNGFALLCYGKTPEQAFGSLTQRIWQRLGVRRVCVLPPSRAAPAHDLPGLAVVRDAEGTFASIFKGHEGRIVLLRPDRYVAGTCTADQANDFAAAFEKLAATGKT